MKKLLASPHNISAPNNTPDDGELIIGGDPEVHDLEMKYREKLPWVMAISQQLAQAKAKKTLEQEKVIDTREHELDSFSVEPRLPEKPKPSVARSAAMKLLSSEVKRSVNFQAYKSTRPDLLQKLTILISKGLTEIQKTHPQASKQEETETEHILFLQRKFQLYATVFEKYIDESTLYRKVLEEIHDGYHEYIEALQYHWENLGNSSQQLKKKEQESISKMQEMQQIHTLKYQVLQETNRLLEKKVNHYEMEKSRLETETLRLRESYQSLKKEYDEIRASAVTLTSALSRMEEEHRVFQANEANRLTEITLSKVSEQKLNEEIDRLQLSLQNMEQIQSNMVQQDVVSGLEATIENLRSEVKRMEITHRQLLLRYASVKSVVDDCFKKWEKENNSGI